jgi:hypothetical protein
MTKHIHFLISIAFVFVLYVPNAKAQLFQNYGINVGYSLVNQKWIQKSSGDVLFDAEYLQGISFMVAAEKHVLPFADLKLETGYLKKGFNQSCTLMDENGTWLGEEETPLKLHYITLGTAIKMRPVNRTNFPYVFMGLRADYLIASKDAVIIDPLTQMEISMYKEQLEKFRDFSFGALFGFGYQVTPLIYVEVEANPSLGSILNDELQTIKSKYWAIRLGVNFNKQQL